MTKKRLPKNAQPEEATPERVIAPRRIWAAGTLFFALASLVPWIPANTLGPLDVAWTLALQEAWLAKLDFGHDLTFTYGPWGFIHLGYHPDTRTVAIFCHLAIAVTAWWGIWSIANRFIPKSYVAAGWSVIVILALGLIPELTLFSAMLLLPVVHFHVDNRPFSPLRVALIVISALLGLAKFSSFIMAVIVLFFIGLDELLRRDGKLRRIPISPIIYCVALLAFWLAASQPLSSLVPFLRRSIWVAGGYAEAMAMNTDSDVYDVVLYSLCAASAGSWAAVVLWRHHRNRGLLSAGALAALLWLGLKAGYVRHDSHELNATGSLMVLALLYGLVATHLLRLPRAYLLHATTTLPVLLLLSASHARWTPNSLATYAVSSLASAPYAIKPACLFMLGDRKLRELYVETRQQVMQRLNPPMRGNDQGGVDVYPLDLSLIFAGGLKWNSRPVFQSYSAYTIPLLELNRRHLTDPAAPEWVLFSVLPFDKQLPSLADSISWPELWTRYDASGTWRGYVILRRTDQPRSYRLTPISQTTARLGETVPVPAVDEGPVWARVELEPTLAGRAAELLFKPPATWITITIGNDTQHFRLAREIARAGFLISPFVGDSAHFAAVGSSVSQWPHQLRQLAVRKITISGSRNYTAQPPRAGSESWALQHEYTIEFSRLQFGAQ